MPLPTPKTDETHDDWVERCMADPTMVAEHDDTDQRLAICQSIWNQSRGKTENKADGARLAERELVATGKDQAAVRMAKRLIDDKEQHFITGYAAVFYDGTPETEYRIWDDVVERIMPGAFDAAIASGQDVRGLFNHDPALILGRTSAGTMSLTVDDKGLLYDIKPGDTTVGRDVVEHVKRGDIDGSSFAFKVVDADYRTEGGTDIIEVRSVDLFDTGPVTYPAYSATVAAYRDREEIAKEVRAAIAKDATDGFRAEQRKRHGWKPRSEEDEKAKGLREWTESLVDPKGEDS